MSTILVQMADRAWTEEALHLACAMARNNHTNVTLLRMIEAQHYSWLGTTLGFENFSADESDALWDYKTIAEKYDVELEVQPMQWISYVGAIIDASDQLEAGAVFACPPHHVLSFMRRFEIWDLRRQLEERNRKLYLLDQPVQSMILAMQVGAVGD
ncbi:MAG TPA: hypothetical protein VHD90_20210 [Phototrophicaceae bacterium]|nr:hypothetical protein [Phototrophicaceae bacterium]